MDVGTFDSLIGGIFKLIAVLAIIGVGYLVQKWARARIGEVRAVERTADEHYRQLAGLAAEQATAIDMVITELSSRPETYSTFPPDIQAALGSAHDRARSAGEIQRKALH